MTTWLVSSTFYGQWLPGDPRGCVTNVQERRPGDLPVDVRIKHAQFGTPYDASMPGLQRAALEQLKADVVSLNLAQAEQLLDQFLETAHHRGWELLAVSLMVNHMHLVVEAPAEAGKKVLLRDFKSYGARRLNQVFGRQASGTWWSIGGSCRPVHHRESAIFYVNGSHWWCG